MLESGSHYGSLMTPMNLPYSLATMHWDGSTLNMDRAAQSAFDVLLEWHNRIKPVPNEETGRILLDSDYYLRLRVGALPKDVDDSEYEGTGLRWPEVG